MSLLAQEATTYRSSVQFTFLDPGSTGNRRPWAFVLSTLQLGINVLASRIDIVHLNVASQGSTWRKLLIARVCRFLGARYVIHLHGGGYREFVKRQPAFLLRQIKLFFVGAESVIVLGDSWSNFVIQDLGVEQSKTFKLANSADGPAALDEEEMRGVGVEVVFLGRLTPQKGLPLLIEAFAQIQDLKSWSAVIAGDGDIDGVRRAVIERSLERVKVVGWLDKGEVQLALERAQIFVLPSRAEGLPISLLQAMAHGLAVITTPVGSIPEVIHDEVNGLLVPVDNVSALEIALRRLIVDPDLRRGLGTAARRAWEAEYNPNRWMASLIDIYRFSAGIAKSP